MFPDRVSNPGPLTYESGALPIALRGPAQLGKTARLKESLLVGIWGIVDFGCGQYNKLERDGLRQAVLCPGNTIMNSNFDVLTEICNKIWRTGEWSTPLTRSLIITLSKRGNLQLCQIYQPHQSFEQNHAESHLK